MRKRKTASVLAKLCIAWAAAIFTVAALGCGGAKETPPGEPGQAAQSEQQKPKQQKQQERQEKNDGPGTQGKGADAGKSTPRFAMRDVEKLTGTENFSRSGLEHIFSGTVNKKGKATGYHYSRIEDSKGRIIDGTRSQKDGRGVFTAKVEVGNVKKDGFSSFYPEDWTPQDVVDAINTAYKEALRDPKNPRGSLWIGHAGKLEIDMYLDDDRKILTAYPIYRGKN